MNGGTLALTETRVLCHD